MLGTYALSAGYCDAYYLKAQKVRTLIRQDFLEAFQRCDALLTPTSPTRLQAGREGRRPHPDVPVRHFYLFDPAEGRTRSMRSKEEAHDYRYFPEPDLQPLKMDDALVEQTKSGLPELPRERLKRFERQYGLSHDDAKLLTADVDRRIGELFEVCAALYKDGKKLANWFKGELYRALNEGQARIDALELTPQAFAALLAMIDKGEISGSAAKDVFNELLAKGGDPAAIVEAKGLRQVSDQGAIEKAVDEVLGAHADEVARYKAVKKQLLGFFTGQVMRAMKGKGNPGIASELLKKKLGG